MVGDRENDIKAGKSVGCMACLISKEKFGQDLTKSIFVILKDIEAGFGKGSENVKKHA